MDRQELVERMLALQEPVTDRKPPHWEYWRHELWRHVVEGEDPNNFASWPCVYHTMLHEHWRNVVDYERGAMGVFVAKGSDNPIWRAMHHQLYHLLEWERVSGKSVGDMESILEFGGGFGAMAQAVYVEMGFRGTYTICDLPEFALLQQYYLSEYLEKERGISIPARWVEKPEKKYDMVIACYSLSETDMATRNQFEKIRADNYLFLYSSQFADYNNVAYFRGFIERHPELLWETWIIEHMPPMSIYSMGWKE